MLALAGLLALANRPPSFSPDFLAEFVLYALSAADLTMLVALVFVLARNIVKLIVERRRALPFARFRAKLVALLLGMTLVPAVLVLAVGSELIRTSVERWFNAPMDEILSSANQIASDYYHERQMLVTDHAGRIARELSSVDLANADVRAMRDLLSPDVTLQRVQMVQVYRVGPASRRAAGPRAGRRRRGADPAAGLHARGRGSAGAADARRFDRDAVDRDARQLGRSAARRRRHPRARRQGGRRRGRDRLPDGRARRRGRAA